MNLISQIFGTNKNASSTTLNGAVADNFKGINKEAEINLPEELFTDNKPPIINDTENATGQSKLNLFLQYDYHQKGFQDGYQHHSNDIHRSSLDSIKSKFHLVIDEMIDLKRAESYKLKNHIIELEGLSERICQQVQNKITELDSNISKLEREQILALNSQGLVSVATTGYTNGFVKGAEQYMIELNITKSTGLFNF